MSDQFDITPRPVHITTPQFQPVWQAIDVSAYDSLAFTIAGLTLSGFTGSCVLQFWGGQQKQTTSGYVALTGNIDLTNASWQFVSLSRKSTPLFRYLLWNMTQMVGSSPQATFFINCLGRKWAG